MIKWDGEKWVTDTEADGAAVEAAEAQRQSLIDAAMASISPIQLKLQAGRKLTQAETTRLNAVLDYLTWVTARIPAPRRMSSGLNCRRRRPFNIWRTGGINQPSASTDNPAHKLYCASSSPFRRPIAAFYRAIAYCSCIVGPVNSSCLYRFSNFNKLFNAWVEEYLPTQAAHHLRQYGFFLVAVQP